MLLFSREPGGTGDVIEIQPTTPLNYWGFWLLHLV